MKSKAVKQILPGSLKARRRKLGIKQAALAQMIGTSQATISKFEASRLGLDFWIQIKLLNALGISVKFYGLSD